jgi:hypothetical protein
MRTAAIEFRFEPAEVATWFDEGNDALRIVAIAIMQARADCRYFPVVLKAVERVGCANPSGGSRTSRG